MDLNILLINFSNKIKDEPIKAIRNKKKYPFKEYALRSSRSLYS
jgi:hypothetical protein